MSFQIYDSNYTWNDWIKLILLFPLSDTERTRKFTIGYQKSRTRRKKRAEEWGMSEESVYLLYFDR